jgi:hypothetical protein
MPKDEFDFEDPFELNGVGIVSAEDTTDAMTECFVEEFMRLGHNHKQIMALFRNPHYIGMNLALEKRGEQFVRDMISEVFARRGKTVTWSNPAAPETAQCDASTPAASRSPESELATKDAFADAPSKLDPMGSPIPDLTI